MLLRHAEQSTLSRFAFKDFCETAIKAINAPFPRESKFDLDGQKAVITPLNALYPNSSRFDNRFIFGIFARRQKQTYARDANALDRFDADFNAI